MHCLDWGSAFAIQIGAVVAGRIVAAASKLAAVAVARCYVGEQ